MQTTKRDIKKRLFNVWPSPLTYELARVKVNALLTDIGPPCAPWCTSHVSGAQCRSVVHNLLLYRWGSAQCGSYKPKHERTDRQTLPNILSPSFAVDKKDKPLMHNLPKQQLITDIDKYLGLVMVNDFRLVFHWSFFAAGQMDGQTLPNLCGRDTCQFYMTYPEWKMWVGSWPLRLLQPLRLLIRLNSQRQSISVCY